MTQVSGFLCSNAFFAYFFGILFALIYIFATFIDSKERTKLVVVEGLEEGHLTGFIHAFTQNRTGSVILGIIKIGKEIPIKASNPVSDLKKLSDARVC